jgi:hypothetical protein
MDVSATHVVTDALEHLGEAERVGPARAPSRFGQMGLAFLTKMQRDHHWRPLILDEREGERETRLAERDSRPRRAPGAKARRQGPPDGGEAGRERLTLAKELRTNQKTPRSGRRRRRPRLRHPALLP